MASNNSVQALGHKSLLRQGEKKITFINGQRVSSYIEVHSLNVAYRNYVHNKKKKKKKDKNKTTKTNIILLSKFIVTSIC